MAKQHDVSGYERIAHVSSQRPGRQRWSELAVYYRDDGQPRYIAEVVGESEFPDEERRVKRNGGDTSDIAMRLFDESGLKVEILRQVGDRLRSALAPSLGKPTPAAIAELAEAAEACAEALEKTGEGLFTESDGAGDKTDDDDDGLRAIVARVRQAIEGVRNG